jgi:predicted RNase H-like HicB family nuclease
MIYLITLETAADGKVVARCPALPGCVSQGRDKKDALEHIQEVITAWVLFENQRVLNSATTEKNALHYVLV